MTPENYLQIWDSSATLLGQLAFETLFGAILGGIPLFGAYPFKYYVRECVVHPPKTRSEVQHPIGSMASGVEILLHPSIHFAYSMKQQECRFPLRTTTSGVKTIDNVYSFAPRVTFDSHVQVKNALMREAPNHHKHICTYSYKVLILFPVASYRQIRRAD